MAQGLWQVPEPKVSIPEFQNSSIPCQNFFSRLFLRPVDSSGYWAELVPPLRSGGVGAIKCLPFKDWISASLWLSMAGCLASKRALMSVHQRPTAYID